MSDINVFLSTTAHVQASNTNTSEIRNINCPICSATICLGMFGYGKDMEREENHYAELVKEMAQIVHIDIKRKLVYIGENPVNEEEGALILYTEENPGTYAQDFFQRWDATHMMMLEFVVYDMKNNIRFVLKGMWNQEEWYKLEIKPGKNFTIIKPSPGIGG